MTVLAPARVGWCPGVLRPMQTGDGLVVRVKPRGGVLSLDQAEAIAGLAIRFGNGELDLTARANLQIRGVGSEDHAFLVQGLGSVGLLDPNAEAEAIRNVLASPLAGLDPLALFDGRSLAAALEQLLVSDTALRDLPAKWSFLVDDGSRWTLSGIVADVRFEPGPDGSMVVGLAGSPLRALLLPQRITTVAAALCRFAVRQREPQRMKALVEQHGAEQVFAAADLVPNGQALDPVPSTKTQNVVGPHRVGTTVQFGVAAAFGHLHANDLLHLIEAARAAQALDLRLTPWRVLLVTGMTEAAAAGLELSAQAAPLVTDAHDPRLWVAACSGAPACRRGSTPVRADAALLAGIGSFGGARDGVSIHVSGCSKGCAHVGAAAWTLVGHEGRYDIVRDGRAADAPMLRGLTFQEASTWLSRLPHEGRS